MKPYRNQNSIHDFNENSALSLANNLVNSRDLYKKNPYFNKNQIETDETNYLFEDKIKMQQIPERFNYKTNVFQPTRIPLKKDKEVSERDLLREYLQNDSHRILEYKMLTQKIKARKMRVPEIQSLS